MPLFGDMQISPFFYIKACPNYDSSKWPACTSSQTSSQANLLGCIDQMREDHDRYISRLSCACNEVITIQREGARSDQENADLYDLALRGLQLLAQWNSKVMELVSELL